MQNIISNMEEFRLDYFRKRGWVISIQPDNNSYRYIISNKDIDVYFISDLFDDPKKCESSCIDEILIIESQSLSQDWLELEQTIGDDFFMSSDEYGLDWFTELPDSVKNKLKNL